MRSQTQVRDSAKKTDFRRDAFRIRPLKHERVRGKGGAALFRKTAGTSGFHEPCSSPQFVSHLVRKNRDKRWTRFCVSSPWSCGLHPARSPASPFGLESSSSATPSWPPKLVHNTSNLQISWPVRFHSSCSTTCHLMFFATIVHRNVCSGIRYARLRCARVGRHVWDNWIPTPAN